MIEIDTPHNRSVFMAAIATETLQILLPELTEKQVIDAIVKATSKTLMDILTQRVEKCDTADAIAAAVDELVQGLETVQAVNELAHGMKMAQMSTEEV